MAKELRLYRPNQKDTAKGTALALQVVKKKKDKFDEWNCFLIGAQQTGMDKEGNAAYSWSDKTKTSTLKLGQTDVSAILAVLQGKRNEAKLFHKTPTNDSTLNFKYDEVKASYYLTLSARKNGEQPVRVNQGITLEEGILIESVLNGFLKLFFFS